MPLNIVITQELYLLCKKGDKDEHFIPILKNDTVVTAASG